MSQVRERRFVWSPAGPGARTDVVPEETMDALRWLGRRLAFEQWLEALRGIPTSETASQRSA